ncbi:MAG: putative toxin-antitoxin system toxin component, PIN family [Caldilineaceae bacterium]|nr:putative toxin-antitoxin system toxin component, PIN family [Caldilineaceae bacterium]
MALYQIVLDTNVLVAGLRSPHGASYQVLRLIGRGYFALNLSVPLVLEYESILKQQIEVLPIGVADVDALIDYICRVSISHSIYYLWRPSLRDPKDEMVLEVAVTAGCDAIVTFNQRDFRGSDQYGIRILKPAALLQEIGVLK